MCASPPCSCDRGWCVSTGPAFSESLDLFLRSSVLGGAYEAMYEALARPFIEPSRKKLLPDWHSLPGVPPDSIGPPTLILDLEDTLVHATWDPKFGWRYVKRPGTRTLDHDFLALSPPLFCFGLAHGVVCGW